MNTPEFENWQRIKDYMEKTQTTDNYFYKRAVAIVANKKDPLDKFNPTDTTDHTDPT
jgi:hypothetical protein